MCLSLLPSLRLSLPVGSVTGGWPGLLMPPARLAMASWHTSCSRQLAQEERWRLRGPSQEHLASVCKCLSICVRFRNIVVYKGMLIDNQFAIYCVDLVDADFGSHMVIVKACVKQRNVDAFNSRLLNLVLASEMRCEL